MIVASHYCMNCCKSTTHICEYSDHERDGSADYFICQVCLYRYSGYTGRYEPYRGTPDMSELTIHTGGMGDVHKINIDCFDHNNIRRNSVLELIVPNQDKPRILQVWMNGILLCTLEGEVMPEGQFAMQPFVCVPEIHDKALNLIEEGDSNWQKNQAQLSRGLRHQS